MGTPQSLRIISNDGEDYYDLDGRNAVTVLATGLVTHEIAPGLVEERYMCHLEGHDYSTQRHNAVLMRDIKTIEAMGRRARDWHSNPELSQSYWFEETARDEGAARRALIYDVRVRIVSEASTNRALTEDWATAELIVTRAEEWESPDYEVLTATVGVHGGTWEVTGTGTAPGRIAKMSLSDPSHTIGEIWIGIREKGLGLDGYVPLGECEDGTLGTDAALVGTSTTYSGDDAVEVDFATDETMETRVTMSLAEFTASDEHHMFGEYFVLLGYRSPDVNSVIQAQISGDLVIAGNPVLCSHAPSGVQIVEMGRVKIPSRNLRGYYTDADLSALSFDIDAEILDYSGSPGSLFLDYVILMPAARLLKIPINSLSPSPDVDLVYFYTHEDGEDTVLFDNDGESSFPRHEAINFYLPPDECVFVFAAEQGLLLVEAATVDIEIQYHPRYESYRGVAE